MNNNFWKSKGGRLAIIAITYVVCFIALLIAWALEGEANGVSRVTMVYMLISVALGFPMANRVIDSIHNLIFGNLFVIVPLGVIFWVRFLLRMIIAFVAGPVLAPYMLGKFIADLVGAR